ncbi:MAG: hypothetical protein BIFFINMI_01266 [Phycisphaerae bacterium]|nr:hypothetical protein [Phycisphaerae bacterium]
MNDRRRFLEVMHYGSPDRAFFTDFSYTEDTLDNWYGQGLPRGTDMDAYFGLDSFWTAAGLNISLSPGFPRQVIEETENRIVERQSDGVTVLRQKKGRTIPHEIDHLLKDRASWEEHYKPRLVPNTAARYPKDWADRVQRWKERDYPVVINGGSLYGWIRDWMGMEAVSYVIYDDAALFEEMVETVADCILGTVERALNEVQFDAVSMWEDMCYRAGPLVSPATFKRVMVPHYKRLTERFRKAGIDVIYLDCDGDPRLLVPHWLDAGVNCMFPIEVGTWGLDVVELRKQYGRDLLMMGGFSKRILAHSREAISAEIDRLAPLIEQGGYVSFCDHRVSPDVPLAYYDYYIDTVRERWCKGLNLRPRQTPVSAKA